MTKEEAAKAAEQSWQLAHQWEREGHHVEASAARQRAIEHEKERDSWLYRVFGW